MPRLQHVLMELETRQDNVVAKFYQMRRRGNYKWAAKGCGDQNGSFQERDAIKNQMLKNGT